MASLWGAEASQTDLLACNKGSIEHLESLSPRPRLPDKSWQQSLELIADLCALAFALHPEGVTKG
jgi:hypothetical protein